MVCVESYTVGETSSQGLGFQGDDVDLCQVNSCVVLIQ